MSKADKAAILAREKEVIEGISQGIRSTELCETLAKKHNVSVKSIQRLYYRIVKGIQDDLMQGREQIRAQLIARADHIYQRCVANNNFKLALSANDQLAKLAGLDRQIDDAPSKPKVLILSERTVEALPEPSSDGNQDEG